MKPNIGKRKHERQECFVPIEGKTGAGFGNTRTVDISQEGVGLISAQPIAVNAKIAIELELAPDQESVLVMGQVRWINRISESGNYRVGLKFTDSLSTDSRNRLGKYFQN